MDKEIIKRVKKIVNNNLLQKLITVTSYKLHPLDMGNIYLMIYVNLNYIF